MISLLRHAPITGVAVLGSIVISYIWGHSTRNPAVSRQAAAAASSFSPAMFMEYLAFPFPGALPRGWMDAGALISLFFQCRVLERQWGTARFLTVSIIPMLFSTLILVVIAATNLVSTPHHQTTPWVAVAAALAYRYYKDIPSLGTSSMLGGKFTVSDKFMVYVALIKILTAPVLDDPSAATTGRGAAGAISSKTRMQQMVLHLLVAFLGLILSHLLRRFPAFSLLPNDSPILKAFRSSTAAAFGPEGQAQHTIPAPLPGQLGGPGGAGPGGAAAHGGGQMLVDDPRQGAMFGGAGLHRGGPRPGAARRGPPAAGGPGPYGRDEGMPGGAGAQAMAPPPPATGGMSQDDLDVGIATIMSLNMPNMTVEKATAALRAAGGNVDQAVGQLMESAYA